MIEPTVLATARLVLRPFQAGDVDDVVAYANDEEFACYLPAAIPYPYSRAHGEAFVKLCMQRDWNIHPEWAIEYGGHVIGAINVRFDAVYRRIGLGYGIGRVHWNRGFTTEAARAALDWGFTAFGAVRAFATADAANVGSWTVMRHLGMTHEATLRGHRTDRYGHQVDEVIYGLLRQEWEQRNR